MDDTAWQDRLAADRMAVDQEFADRVRASPLSSQEWNLVMTAVEFEIEDDGEAARLVADTSKVEHVVPEFENLNAGMPGGRRSSSSGGLTDKIRNALGLSGGVDEEKKGAAIDLADEYARELQRHLDENDRWEEIREAAQQSGE